MTNAVAISFAFVLSIGILVLSVQRDEKITFRYDCGMLIGNWHPDVPKEVVQECRKRSSK
jgi:hypothetical protein